MHVKISLRLFFGLLACKAGCQSQRLQTGDAGHGGYVRAVLPLAGSGQGIVVLGGATQAKQTLLRCHL